MNDGIHDVLSTIVPLLTNFQVANSPLGAPPVSASQSTPPVASPSLSSQQFLARMLLAKSKYYDTSMNQLTLKQWIFQCFIKLKGDPTFPLSDEMTLIRLQEFIGQKIGTWHKLNEVFGKEVAEIPISDELNILLCLSRIHPLFNWRIESICGSPDPVEGGMLCRLPIQTVIKGIQLFGRSLSLQLKGLQKLVLETEEEYKLIEKSISLPKKQRKERQEYKLNREDHFLKLKKSTETLERFYSLRVAPLLSLMNELTSSTISNEKVTVILSECMESINLFLPFQRKIKEHLESEIKVAIQRLHLHKEQRKQVRPQIKNRSISRDPKAVSLKKMSQVLAPIVDSWMTLGNDLIGLIDPSIVNLTRSVRELTSTVESTCRSLNQQHQEKIGSVIGGTDQYVKCAQEAYVRLKELKGALEFMDGTILEFVTHELHAHLAQCRQLRHEEFNDSWLELLDDHISFPRHKEKPKTSFSAIDSQNEISVLESEEELSEEEISTSNSLATPVLSANEISLQLGTSLLERLQQSDPSDTHSLTTLTASIEWISSKIKQSLVNQSDIGRYETKRIRLAQSEASDQAFLSACAFEWLLSHARRGDLLSALAAIRPLVMSWHVMIEQGLFIDIVSEGKEIPHSHHLSQLTRSQDSVFQALDYALIWARYPSDSLHRYPSVERAPDALQWIVKADEWIKQLASGDPWTIENHQVFSQMIQAIILQHAKVQSCFSNLLKNQTELSSQEKELIGEMSHCIHLLLNKLPVDFLFAENRFKPKMFPVIDKIEKKASMDANGSYLIEVAHQLRRLCILSTTQPNEHHLEAWHSGQWIHLQWAIEHAFLYLCKSKGLGLVPGHDFDYFQQVLKDYTQSEDSAFELDDNLQNALRQINVAKGVHYPHLAIWEGASRILIDWTHSVKACRNGLQCSGWLTQARKHSDKSMKWLQREGVEIVSNLMKSILEIGK